MQVSFIFILACADAYLTPHIKTYVQGFSQGFEKQLKVRKLGLCWNE